MLPRAVPIFRWDQKISQPQAVQASHTAMCSGATPAWSSQARLAPFRSAWYFSAPGMGWI